MEDKNNKLDHFLRRHLNDASENQSWNVPDDAIFERAMRTVANEKKKNRRTWILIPLFLLSGLVVNEYLHNRQVKMLEGKIDHLEDSLAIESQDENGLSSASSNEQINGSTTSPNTPSSGSQENYSNPSTEKGLSSTTSSSTTSSSTTSASSLGSPSSVGAKPNIALSNSPSTPSTGKPANAATKKDEQTKSTKSINQLNPKAQSLTSTSDNQAIPLATQQESSNAITNNSSSNSTTNTIVNGEWNAADGTPTSPSENIMASAWMTSPISSLGLKGIENESSTPVIIIAIPANQESLVQIKSLSTPVMRYGILLGANQSWLTMRNIPPTGDAYLYNYDNSQPGLSMYGFVSKSISSRLSWQAGLGYHKYQNRSVLEDQFLFDTDQVTQMPNGDEMFQTDLNLINPIGEYNMPLEFRVSDQMVDEDVLVEYTTIEQTLHSVMLDLELQYTILTIDNFSVSLGTGFGLAYRSGLNNKFNVSTYHNDILLKNQTEAPDHINNVRRWYVQWLGNLNLEYRMSNRYGFILASQYNAGLTSIRNGNNSTGPLTFLHALSLSAGVTHSF